MALTLYFDAMSQPARSVMMFLALNRIPHAKKFINIAKGEHYSNEEFVKVNPQRKIPAIKHGDFCLTESVAILKYLHAKFECPDHWYPSDIQKRARIDEYLSWHHTNVRLGLAMYFRSKVLEPLVFGKQEDAAKLALYLKLAKSATKTVENYFLSSTKFLSSDQISIADLMAVTEFSQLEVLPTDCLDRSPRINLWLQNCKDELGPHYDEIHKITYLLKDRLKSKSNL